MSSPPFNDGMHQSAHNPSYSGSPHRSDNYEYDPHSESPTSRVKDNLLLTIVTLRQVSTIQVLIEHQGHMIPLPHRLSHMVQAHTNMINTLLHTPHVKVMRPHLRDNIMIVQRETEKGQ